MERIRTRGNRLVDEKGRECIFQGINLVDKGKSDANGQRVYSLDWGEDLFRSLREKGFHLLRLGLNWAAVEPEPGKYCADYLERLSRIMDWCETYGIYVILDMHQDLYTSCGQNSGNGAPGWATLTDGEEFEETMLVWAEGYFFNGAVHAAFDHFWANTEVEGKGLQDHFTDMWKHVAMTFREKPALLGFDVFNEPFPGSSGGEIFWTLINTLCKIMGEREGREIAVTDLLPYLNDANGMVRLMEMFDDKESYRRVLLDAGELVRAFDERVYAPFLRKVCAGIREVTEQGILFMENCYYSNLGIPCASPRLVYEDAREEKDFAFTPHGYDLFVDTAAYSEASNNRVDVIFEEHSRTQQRLNAPVIVGEWGGHNGSENGLSHIAHLLEFFDEHKWSNLYWAFSDDIFHQPVMKLLSRPHPLRVPGEILRYGFDAKESVFTLQYENKGESGPVELYLPRKAKRVEGAEAFTLEPYGNEGAGRLLAQPGAGVREIRVYL